ncbi:MAG: hypothetical protein HY763_03175 [Planctomycetes bacterium]|nr:hypothetical protein [Planctomycetota bacterium]
MSRVDAYGNAQYSVDRRAVGNYQNETQRRRLHVYQELDRRPEDRSEYRPIPDPTLPFAGRGMPRPAGAVPGAATTEAARRLFDQYGGFGERRGTRQAPDIGDVLTRRRGLVQATGLGAPVRRALMSRYSVAAPALAIRTTPFLPRTAPSLAGDEDAARAAPEPGAEAAAPTGGAEGETLDAQLRRTVVQAYAAVRAEGWDWFRAGHFRRASRCFESAITLEPGAAEGYVGAIFCHLSNGAVRTAMATLGEMSRRVENPFLPDLDLRERYASALTARQTGFQCQLHAQANPTVVRAVALHALVLWYVGEREQAELVASGVAQTHPGTVYAGWPARMAAAAARPAADVPDSGAPSR